MPYISGIYLKLPINGSIIWGVLCLCVSYKNYKTPFNDCSGTSFNLITPQYFMITYTSRSSISFLCYYDFILIKYYSMSSITMCSASTDRPKLFLLIITDSFLLPLKNLSNQVPLVGVVVTSIFMSALAIVTDPLPRTA